MAIVDNKSNKKTIDERAAFLAKEMREIKGTFKNYERPGGKLKFSFSKFAEVPLKTYELEDSKTYSLPLCVVRHLNHNCKYTVHKFAKAEDGLTPLTTIGTTISRFGFDIFDFIADEEFIRNDIREPLVTVETIRI